MMQTGDILVAIPSYRPSDQLVDLVRVLIAAHYDVLVVDDGSGSDSEPILRRVQEIGARVEKHPRNRGIAAALNTALDDGAQRRVDWLFTLDQDSIPEGGFLQRAMDFIEQCDSSGMRVGVATPAANNGVRIAGKKHRGAFHPYDPIQSGSLVSIPVAREVGGFRTDYIIDGVDSEMTARVRRAGFSVVSVPGTDMRHSLGHRVPASLAGKKLRRAGKDVTVNQHAPFRVYYMARNGIAISATYFRSNPLWVMRRLGIEMTAHIMRVVFGERRRTQLKAIGWGVSDGLRRRMGPLDQARFERLQSDE